MKECYDNHIWGEPQPGKGEFDPNIKDCYAKNHLLICTKCGMTRTRETEQGDRYYFVYRMPGQEPANICEPEVCPNGEIPPGFEVQEVEFCATNGRRVENGTCNGCRKPTECKTVKRNLMVKVAPMKKYCDNHTWGGEPQPCKVYGGCNTNAKDHHIETHFLVCTKCGMTRTCATEQGCWHYFIYKMPGKESSHLCDPEVCPHGEIPPGFEVREMEFCANYGYCIENGFCEGCRQRPRCKTVKRNMLVAISVK